jgi:hypothetical protein
MGSHSNRAYFRRKNQNPEKRQNAKKKHRHPKKNGKKMWGQSSAVLGPLLGPILEGPEVCAGSPKKTSGEQTPEVARFIRRKGYFRRR